MGNVKLWPQTLLECQQEITDSLTTYGYYQTRYRSEELLYWSAIPKFIANDKNHGKVFKSALDIGCAFGTLAVFMKKFTGCDVYCIDYSYLFRNDSLYDKHGIQWKQINIEFDGWPKDWPRGFDAIIMTEVIEHFNFHPLATMKRIADSLNSGGMLYLSTPDAEQWGKVLKYKSIDEIPAPDVNVAITDDHVWQYTKNEIIDLLNKVGLSVTRFVCVPGVMFRHINLTAVKI